MPLLPVLPDVPIAPHPIPGLAQGQRTLYALQLPDGRLLGRNGKPTRQLREAELRARAQAFTSLRRIYGGTVWRVTLSLHSPAITPEDVR